MSVEKTMAAYTKLVQDLTTAIAAAAKSGMTSEDIKAALELITGLVESSDDV